MFLFVLYLDWCRRWGVLSAAGWRFAGASAKSWPAAPTTKPSATS